MKSSNNEEEDGPIFIKQKSLNKFKILMDQDVSLSP